MFNEEQINAEKKSSLLNYVGDFIEKRDNVSRKTTGDDRTRSFDKDLVTINTSEGTFQHSNLNDRTSESTDIDVDEFSLVSDPIVETQEGGEQVYKQQVYFRQYQPPTPEPINIEIQEIALKPQVQRPSIHVHVRPNQYRDEQRTPSPIVIKGVPPQLPPTCANQPTVYNKYVSVQNKPPQQQVIIHRYPELPPKPRPIVVEQWFLNESAPKRITYRDANHNQSFENDTNRQHNRYIEYKVPSTTVQLEITRLPVITLNPKEYKNRSNQFAQLETIRTLSRDLNMFPWRI